MGLKPHQTPTRFSQGDELTTRSSDPPPTISTPTGEAELILSELAERTLHRRAVEAVIWGMPAINYDLMYQALVRDARRCL
jgi:hypothetical protein